MNPGETGVMFVSFNYTAMRAAIFVMNADISNWSLADWDAFYPEIASWAQLNDCRCGRPTCFDHNKDNWN